MHNDDSLPPDGGSRSQQRTARAMDRQQARRRRAVLTFGTIAAVLVVGLVAAYLRFNGNIDRLDVTKALGKNRPSAAGNISSGPLNILLIGSDIRTGEGNEGYGTGDWEPGQHSDTNLLLHISADRKNVTMVSIPRDSMVPAPVECNADAPVDQWQVRQWNKNFNTGGPGCVMRTLEGNTDIFVNHFAVVDFGGFKNMVDALGGVEVCTPTPINDPKAKLTLAAGRHTLQGEQALGYVRARYTVGDGSDLGRIKRQQAFMSSVAQKATESSLLLRPDKLLRFLDAATQSLTTDPDFGIGAMKDVAQSIKNIGVDNIQFVTVPTEPYPQDPNRVQWAPAADELWTAIREDRDISKPKPTPSPSDTRPLTVSPDEITVEVVNSSGVVGLSKQAAEGLRVQGFNEVTTSNGHGVVSGVTIEYAPEQAEAARTVAAAFPGAVLTEDDGLGKRVRVTLGSGAPNVVEVPNRLGEKPLPTPTLTSTPTLSPTIQARKASQDICS
ncbi:LytR family transcriptional attenuator [Knoellia remsis]|uniref:LytR family transcriptional attenuator n=1 Tax=Knoellia remsis TaxID=407159 RepID=A0A2T0TX74_9MICO|nr:LCP family protein [Knoellia remsis]PRY50269.1 LytR family transcriptional attenuator [Knoellia remsis]